MHIQHKYSYLTVGSISCHLTKLSFPIRYPVQTKFQKISISNMCQKHHMDIFTLFKLLLFPPQKKKKKHITNLFNPLHKCYTREFLQQLHPAQSVYCTVNVDQSMVDICGLLVVL